MRILVTSTWGHGHVFPMVPLARALVAAGHEVLWATNEQACPLVAAAGLDVAQAGLRKNHVADLTSANRKHIALIAPPERHAFAFPFLFGLEASTAMLADLVPLARDWRPDLVIHEPAELAGSLLARRHGIPSITHSFGGSQPSGLLTDAGNRVAPLWSQHGFEVPAYAGAVTGPYLDICPASVQTVPLDYIPLRYAMRPLSYTGEARGELPDIVARDDGRPLVYFTLGTVQNHAPVLVAAVTALAQMDVRVLVTVGEDGDPGDLGPQPPSVGVERWVCQSQVLPRCAAVVSHGGSGTFLGALALGVPQLCLPQAADQFRNAQAVVSSGSGLALSPDQARRGALAEHVRRILTSTSYRDGAGRVAEEIAAMPSPEDVVPLIEQLCAAPA